MKRLKELADPENLLNPGVIINPDPTSHLRDLKPHADGGGRGRQVHRVRLLRVQVSQPRADDHAAAAHRGAPRDGSPFGTDERSRPRLYAALDAKFPYDVLDTCATDGLCATACPVSIDTGQLTKRFRKVRHTPRAHRIAIFLARNFALVERGVRTALWAGHVVQSVFGAGAMMAVTKLMRAVAGDRSAVDARHAACRRASAGNRARAGAGGLFPELHLAYHGARCA